MSDFYIDFVQEYSRSIFIEKRILRNPYRQHTHDYTELTIVFKGTASHIINKHELTAKAGDVFILKPGVIHSFPDVSEFGHYVFSYVPAMLDHIGLDLQQTAAYQTLFAIGHSPEYAEFDSLLRLSLDALGKVEALVDSMLDELRKKRTGFSSIVNARFIELVALLCREYENQGIKTGTPPDINRAAKLASFIENNFRNPLSFSSVAKKLGVSTRQLRRIFKKHYGISPLDYLMRVRIYHAANMLNTSSMNITEIASSCGFYDSNYLSHQFKKTVGISPRQWRSQQRCQDSKIFRMPGALNKLPRPQ